VAAHPRATLTLAAAPVVVWNLLLVEQVRRGLVPRDDTVAFPRLVGNAAGVFADALGSPRTWPASWIFAARHGRPPGQYDLLVGRYLFYRQNNLGGHLELGVSGDDAMLGEGWGPIENAEGVGFRRSKGRARLFAPLDVPEDLEIRIRARASGGLTAGVAVNGRPVGDFRVEGAWSESRLRVPAGFWRRELNEVALDGAGLEVDAVDFARTGTRQPDARGFRAR
jgi:hypothetical protein